MFKSLLLVLALGTTWALPGCTRKRDSAAADLEALSNDVCLRDWLSESRRKRLVERAKRGEITPEQVDAYIKDIRARVREGVKRDMNNDSFCRIQRNVWRRHFKG